MSTVRAVTLLRSDSASMIRRVSIVGTVKPARTSVRTLAKSILSSCLLRNWAVVSNALRGGEEAH